MKDSEGLGGKLESIAKGSTLVVGILYGTGLIVGSLRYAQLGLTTTEFAKPLYFLTGFWFWSPVLACGILFIGYPLLVEFNRKWFIRYPRQSATLASRVRWTLLIHTISVVMVGLAARLFYDAAKMVNSSLGKKGFGADLNFFWSIAVVAPMMLFIVFTPSKSDEKVTKHTRFLQASVLVIMLTTYLALFSFTTYLQIPTQLGGGRPRLFAFSIDEWKTRYALTGEVEAKSPVIVPVLAETTDHYVVPAPEIKPPVYSVSPDIRYDEDWNKDATFRDSFIILPKDAVKLATVIGGVPATKSVDERLQSAEDTIKKADKVLNEATETINKLEAKKVKKATDSTTPTPNP